MKSCIAIVSGVLAALAMWPPSSARADWAYTHWGMTAEQVAAASTGMVKVLPSAQRTRVEINHWELAAEGTYTDGPLRMRTGFMFDTQRGGLTCVMSNVNGSDVEVLKAILVKRYGPPKSHSNFASTESLTWRNPDDIEFVAGQQPVAAVVSHCAPNAN